MTHTLGQCFDHEWPMFCTIMSKFRSNELVFSECFDWKRKTYMFKCLLCNGKNTRVYDSTRFRVDLPLSDSIFFHLFSRSEQHDAMTQILTPQYTFATLQVYYCRLWCELRVFFKGIAVNYLFIPIYTNYTNTQQQQQQQQKEALPWH